MLMYKHGGLSRRAFIPHAHIHFSAVHAHRTFWMGGMHAACGIASCLCQRVNNSVLDHTSEVTGLLALRSSFALHTCLPTISPACFVQINLEPQTNQRPQLFVAYALE